MLALPLPDVIEQQLVTIRKDVLAVTLVQSLRWDGAMKRDILSLNQKN